MRTLRIKEALLKAGVNAEEVKVTKNGVICTGFRIITDGNVTPVVYFSPEESIEEYVNKVLDIISRDIPAFNLESILNREWILKNCYLCVQKKSDEALVKREILNLEQYVRIAVSTCNDSVEEASIKVNLPIIEAAGISERELFEASRRNSIRKTVIKSITEVLGVSVNLPMYVATYQDRNFGAGILSLNECFKKFCESLDVSECYILPSSIEELIILPDGNHDSQELVKMVKEINECEVKDILQLDPVVYRYDVGTDEVSIVASLIKSDEVA